jgi:hypothetical protein
MERVRGTASLQYCAYSGSADVPKGNAAAPWLDKGNNWYWRAWQTRCLLRWLEGKMPCSTLMCVGDTMRQIFNGMKSSLAGESADHERRSSCAVRVPALRFAKEVGSRWYASIYFMHKDIWGLAQQLPVDEVVRIAMENGCTPFAAAYRARVSTSWTPEQLVKEPFPGFSATSTLSWECAQKMIPALSAEVTRRMPRSVFSAEQRRRLFAMKRVETKRLANPGLLRLARMIHTERIKEESREKWVKYGVPIGIGVGLVAIGGGLYWYMTKDRGEP